MSTCYFISPGLARARALEHPHRCTDSACCAACGSRSQDFRRVGPVAQAMVERVQDQIPLHVGDRPADESRVTASAVCAARSAGPRAALNGVPSGMRIASTPISAPLPAARRGAWCFPVRARCPAIDWTSAPAALQRKLPDRHAVGFRVVG
jgi:hypothetical protein